MTPALTPTLTPTFAPVWVSEPLATLPDLKLSALTSLQTLIALTESKARAIASKKFPHLVPDARTGVVDHAGILIQLNGKPEHDRTPPGRIARWFRPVRRVPAVTGACLLIERALWDRCGGFDERYRNGGEDIDLCFRARSLGRVNAVALRSVVRHHVSASIGRKLHDEKNSFLLAQRWRHEFASDVLATRLWCRDYLAKIESDPRLADPVLARRAWFHARFFRRQPPPEAIAGLEAALDGEFSRWETILGPAKRS
jgi:GT2 family glycosyltransferase